MVSLNVFLVCLFIVSVHTNVCTLMVMGVFLNHVPQGLSLNLALRLGSVEETVKPRSSCISISPVLGLQVHTMTGGGSGG